jgi:ferredoxin
VPVGLQAAAGRSLRGRAPGDRRRPRGARVGLPLEPEALAAHGMCAELLPERIRLDDWGYPLIADPEVPDVLLELDRRAAAACPTLALLLERPRS